MDDATVGNLSWQRRVSFIECGAILASLVLMGTMRKLRLGRWLIEHRVDIGIGCGLIIAKASLVAFGFAPESWAPLCSAVFLIPWMATMCLFFSSIILRGDHPPRHFHRFTLLIVLAFVALRILRSARAASNAHELEELSWEWITIEVISLWVVKLRLAPGSATKKEG